MIKNAFKLCRLRDRTKYKPCPIKKPQNVRFVKNGVQAGRKTGLKVAQGLVLVTCVRRRANTDPQDVAHCRVVKNERFEEREMLAILEKTKTRIENGDVEEAERLLTEGLTRSRERQLKDWSNVFLLLLGKISLRKKEYDKSEKLYDELVANLQSTLEKTPAIHRLTLWAYIDLAQLYSETTRFDKAEELYKHSLHELEIMFVDAADFRWAVETLQIVLDGYSHLLVTVGRYREALDHRETVHSLYKTLYGEKHQKLVYNLNEFGRIYTFMGDDDKAIEYFGRALEMAKTVQVDPLEVCALYVNSGRVHLRKGVVSKAMQHCTEAMIIARRMKNPLGEEEAGKCLEDIRNHPQQF